MDGYWSNRYCPVRNYSIRRRCNNHKIIFYSNNFNWNNRTKNNCLNYFVKRTSAGILNKSENKTFLSISPLFTEKYSFGLFFSRIIPIVLSSGVLSSALNIFVNCFWGLNPLFKSLL